MSRDTRERYQMIDVNVYQENIFHTKMLLKDFDIDQYLFGQGREDYSEKELKMIGSRLRREMAEIFYGRNLKRSLRLT